MELTCTGAIEYGSIVYYSHLIPVSVIIVLVVFILFKTKFNLLSKIFALFNMSFVLWLLGDVVVWISTNYNVISFFWASLDYVNILSYLFAAYFFYVLVFEKDFGNWLKLSFLILSLPAWYITFTNNSITAFSVAGCEALNNVFLTNYKLGIELFVIVVIIAMTIYVFLREKKRERKIQIGLVSISIIAFFVTFSVTEYISSNTGLYEINLYSLFILPVFLFMIIFAITHLSIFKIRTTATQLLVYVMIILVGSQFFFLENATNQVLTVITFVLSLSFGVVLLMDGRRDIQQRLRIEALAADLTVANNRLVELDKQKSEFVSFATHQLRAPLTAMKGYTSLILEGELGSMNDEIKKAVKRIFDSSNTLANIINDYLNISRIELGTLKYNFEIVDFRAVVSQVIDELKPSIDKKGLKFSFMGQVLDDNGYIEAIGDSSNARFIVHADKEKIKQVITNLIDNALKYTPSGSIVVRIVRNIRDRKILFTIKDTGMGIAPEVMPKLFEKFVRSDRANKQNIYGTGLGLYLARQIMMSHKGRIWAESLGEGKGSTFFLELDMEV